MSFIDFIQKYTLKSRDTSNIKLYQILCPIGLNIDSICLREGPFDSDIGIVILHPTKETHWIVDINENYFDSNGCSPLSKLSKFIMKRNGLLFNFWKQNTRFNEYLILSLCK